MPKFVDIPLDEIVDSLQDAVWSLSWPDYSLMYVSRSVEGIYGYSVEAFYANPTLWVDITHPDDRQRTQKLFENIINLGSTDSDRRIFHKDGSIRWVNDKAQVIFDGLGNPQRVDGIVRDITHFKETELALKERIRSERLVATISRKLLQASPDNLERIIIEVLGSIGDLASADRAYVVLFEPDGFRIEGGYEWCGEQIPAHVNGVIGYDMVEFPWYVGKLRESTPVYVPSVAQMPEGAAIFQHVLMSEGVRSLLSMPMVREGGVIGFVGIDAIKTHRTWSLVTRTLLQVASDLLVHALVRQGAEAKLKRLNYELKGAVEAKDQFLANMSHELRTPLHALLLRTEMLQAGLYGALNERQTRSMGVIFDSGQHLLSLINDVLDLAKIGAGKVELVKELVLVGELCQVCLNFIKQLAFDKGLKVFLNVDQGVRYVEGDERRLKQILVNLLSNAVTHTPRGGRIGLDVVGDVSEGCIRFEVWDTGVGIVEEERARIFEPFIQLEVGDGENVGGTGLGLSLVKRMTELHGGEVFLVSSVGVGSRFTVALPWSGDEVGEVVVKEEGGGLGTPAGNNPLILIAEDNQVVVESLLDFFEHQQYRTLVARHGLEVLNIVQTIIPDVILMDIQMPFMDGLETIRQLRAEPRFEAVPIIAVTAYAMSSDRERCMAAGANAFLSKPLNLQELSDTISRTIVG